jgi:transglutaminase-like putative cysteine protease
MAEGSRHVRTQVGWRIRTEHVTTFDYSSPARASYNEVRKTPRTTSTQTALEARVQTLPVASLYSYSDYFGTQVSAFNVDAPHERLVVTGSSLVETHRAEERPEASWAEIEAAAASLAEWCAPSRYTEPSAELIERSQELRRPSPVDTIEGIVGYVHGSLGYVKGVTGVHTSAQEAYADGRGVCQDFAHLALLVLRTAGIPARYVSGYLHPERDPEVGTSAKGESHAWIEAWAGRWWGLDPTNDVDIGRRHVVVARARDYADVPPMKGVYAGTAEHEASVVVTITRTA